VQRVGEWIGGDADGGRLDADKSRVQLLGSDWKAATCQFGGEHLSERGVACDVVLPQLALGLVHRHGGPASEVGALKLWVGLALV